MPESQWMRPDVFDRTASTFMWALWTRNRQTEVAVAWFDSATPDSVWIERSPVARDFPDHWMECSAGCLAELEEKKVLEKITAMRERAKQAQELRGY